MSARTAPTVTRTARRLWALAYTALPAGAAEARTTIELHLAGREVAVDVDAPAHTARGAAILSHGFTRSRTTRSDHARAVAARWGAALPALVSDRVIEGAPHSAFEAPSDWLCRLACDATDAARQAVVRATLLQAVERWLPRGTR
ncbi:hypothetical protein [Azohydromonas sediminis]|uniref:hypothetical protein n=1 Tax=Azohydromonas sediminis TaxID=2259674 RepID=UPI0013C329EB|nr:hypothetical protein [Azohydromonas sediminis]